MKTYLEANINERINIKANSPIALGGGKAIILLNGLHREQKIKKFNVKVSEDRYSKLVLWGR